MDVKVARVIGDKPRNKGLRRKQAALLERQVGRTVSAYFNDAFLAGDYPRGNFTSSFDRFAKGAQSLAWRDRTLLTNASTGRSTVQVVPRRKWVRLDVLSARKVAAGVTARIHLVFDQERTGGLTQRVTLTGRLLMSRRSSGGWEIFGYDVARSSVPAPGGGGR